MSQVFVRLLPWRTRPTAQRASVASCRRLVGYYRSKPSKSPNKLNAKTAKWQLARLGSTAKYPISVQLAAHGLRPDPWNSNSHYVRMRPQIVSPDLCDDVLNYLAPTLEKHKGCDILDINPGAALWSQKLHDFLQPRSHILFESSPKDYSEFLDPLVNQPDSRYKIAEGDIRDFLAHDRVLDEGAFPHQKVVDPATPEAQLPNNTLLVTGQLIWDPKAPGWNFDSLARQMIITFARAASSNKGVHRYGLIRSLFWMTEDEFKVCVPRSHHFFSKYSSLMRVLSTCNQVVTAGHTPKSSGHGTIARDAQYEIQSVMRAMNRGRKNGHEMPKHRREDIHDFAEEIEKLKGSDGRLTAAEAQAFFWEKIREGKSASGLALESFIELVRTTIALEKDPDMFKDMTPTPRQRRLWRSTPEGKKYMIKKSSTNQAQRFKIKMEASAEQYEAIYDQECKILGMKDGAEKDAAYQELESLMDAFHSGLNNLPIFRHTGTLAEGNERISLRVPRLDWDMRPYEPLIMQEDEVWPSNRVALLDMEPRPLLNRRISFESIQDFVYGLFTSPSHSVLKALEALQPGASQIADNCPSLTDPKKGGRLNLDMMPVNMLTNEMVTELALAFKEWPFRDDRVGSSLLHYRMDV